MIKTLTTEYGQSPEEITKFNNFFIAEHSQNFPFSKFAKLFRPKKSRINRLSEGTKSQISWALSCLDYLKKEQKLEDVKKIFSGQVLIDLGSGRGITHALNICSLLDVEMYIGVDKNPSEQRLLTLGKVNHGIPSIVFAEDLLYFIRNLNDGVANFMLNGIDNNVIRNKIYREDLVAQINRITPKEGGMIGFNNYVYERLIENYGWEPTIEKDLGIFGQKYLGIKKFT